MNKSEKFPFPLAVQLTLPREDNAGFHGKLALLQRLGFHGVELNVLNTRDIPPKRLGEILGGHQLRLLRVATGAMAVEQGLSLSNSERKERERAQQGMARLMEYAAFFQADLIVGYIKGGPGPNKEEAEKRLADSMAALEGTAVGCGVRMMLEPTNRYEAEAVHTLADAAAIIDQLDRRAAGMLPDTFHMNIEECDMAAALMRYQGYYSAVHISDNNRYFPGLGGIDFRHLVTVLEGSGFDGYLGVEGNLFHGFERDITVCAQMMEDISRRLQAAAGA